MSTRKQIIAAHLEELAELQDAVVAVIAGLDAEETLPGAREIATRAVQAMGPVGSLRGEFWDLEPDLVYPGAAPGSDADLTVLIANLAGYEGVMRSHVLQQALRHAPPSVVAAVGNARSQDEKTRLLQEWWDAQPRPFVPIDLLDRELDGRRWRRIHAARALAKLEGVSLIDEKTGDIDEVAVARWRRTRAAEQEDPGPGPREE